MGEERDVDALIQALKNEDYLTRIKAVKALGEIGDSRVVEPLIKALKDEEGHVRREVVRALGKIGDKRAIEPLIEALKDWRTRKEAAEALGKRARERARANSIILEVYWESRSPIS